MAFTDEQRMSLIINNLRFYPGFDDQRIGMTISDNCRYSYAVDDSNLCAVSWGLTARLLKLAFFETGSRLLARPSVFKGLSRVGLNGLSAES